MVDKFVKAITGTTKPPKVKAAPAPVEKPATPMPDEEELRRNAMKMELQRKRTGRESTNLVNEEEDNL